MLYLLLACMVSGDTHTYEEYHEGQDVVECAATSSKSTLSSARIGLYSGGVEVGHGSGNYFKFGKHRFLLTAAHVVEHDGDINMFIKDGENLIGFTVAYVDTEKDIAIIVPNEDLSHVKARRWKVNKDKDMLGETVNYAGYPAGLGKVLIRGMVSAHYKERLIVQGFALPGASGSVVFDKSGRVVGVVSAIALHQSSFSIFPELQEDMVYISNADFLTKKFLREVFKCVKTQ